jgi:hypothetical protein
MRNHGTGPKFVFVGAYRRKGFRVSAYIRLAYCLPDHCQSPLQLDFGF